MSQCHMCIGLVQMEAERDAQAAQARRVVIELQTVTAQRDRLRDAIGTHRDAMLSSDPMVDGSTFDDELWSVLDDVGGDR